MKQLGLLLALSFALVLPIGALDFDLGFSPGGAKLGLSAPTSTMPRMSSSCAGCRILPDLNVPLYAADSTSLRHKAAMEWLDHLRSSPTVVPLNPGKAHAGILRHHLLVVGTGGNLTTDARIVTGDRDFSRFPGLKVEFLF